MAEHVLDGSDNLGRVAADLLRTGFHAAADSANGSIVLKLQGELDMATAPGLGQAVNRALDARPTTLCLDLTDLSFLDSTGIHRLLAGHRRATAQSVRLVIVPGPERVQRTFALCGLLDVLPFVPGASSADGAWAA